MAKLELRQQRLEVGAFLCEPRTGRIHFLDHGSILLRGLIHVVDGGVDLGKAGRLFLRRRGDGVHVAVDGKHQLLDLGKPDAGIGHQLHAFAHRNG